MFGFFKKRKDPRLVFWKKINGHNLYYFRDYTDMSTNRLVLTRIVYNQMGLGLTIGDIIACSEKVDEYLNQSDIAKAAFVNGHLRTSASNYMGAKVSIQLGGCGVVVDDEPIESYSETHMEIKRNLVENYDEVRYFFLSKAIEYLMAQKLDLKDLSERELLEDLQKIMDVEKTFLSLIGSSISKNLWKV